MRIGATLSLAAVLLGGSALADDWKSGPQVGEGISGRFEPAWLNGDPGGPNHCPV
jgi:hypothetical protein